VKAVVYSGYGITPTLRQVSDPACPDDGAVLAVGATTRVGSTGGVLFELCSRALAAAGHFGSSAGK